MKLVKIVTPAAIAILLLAISCTGPAETPGTPTPTPTLPTQGETIVVTSTADSGSGTLRQALLDAQRDDTITFDPAVFPPNTPATIYLTSSLPVISQGNLKIDASNAGVILDGSKILNTSGDWISGLEINSDGNIIQGLQIVNFSPACGIALGGGAQNNIIGGDRSVGSGPLGQGNLVSKVNTGIALFDDGTSFNTITGNLIGTDPTGTEAWGNDVGVDILKGASRNIIGPDNIIAYNNDYNVNIRDSNSCGNTITQNSIHDSKGRVFEVKEGGIYLEKGGNTELPAPVILDFDLAAGTVTGFACADCTVETFSDSSNEGEVYEGRTTANGTGAFTFNKSASFAGSHLTATATDGDGNTSEFSTPSSGTYRSTSLQERNDLPKIQLQPKPSPELEDNHIGVGLGTYYKEDVPIPSPFYFDSYGDDPELVYSLGFKWIRIAFDDWVGDALDWQNVEVEPGEYLIKPESEITGDKKLSGKTYPATHPSVDEVISDYASNDITIVLNLGVGNEDNHPDVTRFRDNDTLERYCNYVRFMVDHFKDRIRYYEIWNEPEDDPEDYINLVKHVVPVIREENPEAKIVIGALCGEWITGYPGYDVERYSMNADYIKEFLGPDLAPIIDVISWHPLYNNRPNDPYYQNYPQMIKEIKEFAASNGFKGEYLAEEITWRTYQTEFEIGEQFSENVAKKYYARAIIMHRGVNVTVSILLRASGLLDMIPNICTAMAGAEPVSLPLEIESEATNIKSYGFSLPNGDKLLALWTDGTAIDDDPGIEATLTIPGFSAQKVVGIDVLNGFEQEMITSIEDGDLVIQNLLVKDYPVILHLSD